MIPATRPRSRPWYASTQLRAAAAVLIVAGTTLLVIDRQDKSFVETSARDAAAPLVEREQAGAFAAPSIDANAGVPQEGAATSPTATLPDAPSRARAERDLAAPKAAQKSAPMSANQAAEPRVQSPAAALAGKTVGAKIEVREESDKRAAAVDKATADSRLNTVVVAPAPETPRQTLGAAVRDRDSSGKEGARARIMSGGLLSEVVVTGVSASVPELKKLRADTTGNVRHTIYEVAPGVQVTLTETEPAGFRRLITPNRISGERALESARPPAPAAAAAPAPPPSVASAQTSAKVPIKPVTSISWTDPVTGRGYVLSGPLTKEELEAIRQRIPKQR